MADGTGWRNALSETHGDVAVDRLSEALEGQYQSARNLFGEMAFRERRGNRQRFDPNFLAPTF